MNKIITGVGSACRSMGQTLDKMGAALEVGPYIEHLVPSTKILAHAGKVPIMSETVFCAPSATVIGDVSVGSFASIWYGASLRGDVQKISVGEYTSIGDKAIIHVAKFSGRSLPTKIGNNVTIGAKAMIHACELEDSCTIGPGVIVMDGAKISTSSVIAAGSLVTMDTIVPAGQLWSGIPAKYIRDLTEVELASAEVAKKFTFELSRVHFEECEKSYEEVEADAELYEDIRMRDPEYFPRLDDTTDPADVQGRGVPGRVFESELSTLTKDTIDAIKKSTKTG